MTRQVLWSLASGILLILSFPPFNWEFLAWFAFVPVLLAVDQPSCRRPFFCAYSTGLVFWLGTIYWLMYVTAPGTIVLCLYLALFFGLFGRLLAAFNGLPQGGLVRVLALSGLWVCLEYLRGYLLTGFPWNLLGYSQYLHLPALQIADFAGAWGVSFSVMLSNAGIAAFIRYRRLRTLLACLLILAAVHLYGSWRIIQERSRPWQPEVSVAVVQGNIPQQLKWQPAARPFILQKYLRLSRQALLDRPELIVWPEAALPVILEDHPEYAEAARSLVKESGVPLLFGAVTSPDEEAYYNSAVLYAGKGEVRYNKLHLVPFGEYIPLRSLLPFLDTFVPIGDVGRGKEHTLFKLPSRGGQAVFAVLICFEDVFPELSRRFIRDGAQFLVNITNDAWYERTAASYQHLQASVLRAVENRAWVIRSANTGISGFIDPSGRAVALVQDGAGNHIFVDGLLQGRVPVARSGSLTFYSRWGDVFVFLCMIGVLFTLACSWRVAKRARA